MGRCAGNACNLELTGLELNASCGKDLLQASTGIVIPCSVCCFIRSCPKTVLLHISVGILISVLPVSSLERGWCKLVFMDRLVGSR